MWVAMPSCGWCAATAMAEVRIFLHSQFPLAANTPYQYRSGNEIIIIISEVGFLKGMAGMAGVLPQQQNFAMGSLAQISSGAIRCSFNTRFRARFRGSGGFRCRWRRDQG